MSFLLGKSLRIRQQEETTQNRGIFVALRRFQKALNQSQETKSVLTAQIQAGTKRLMDYDRKFDTTLKSIQHSNTTMLFSDIFNSQIASV